MKRFGKLTNINKISFSFGIHFLCMTKNLLTHYIFSMRTASKELKKLRSMAENSLNKTAELQQLLAQLEATLSSAETQKVIDKTNKIL